MKIVREEVVRGQVDAHSLGVADGAFVGVLVPDQEPFELSGEQIGELKQSIDEADQGGVVDGWQLLDDIRR